MLDFVAQLAQRPSHLHVGEERLPLIEQGFFGPGGKLGVMIGAPCHDEVVAESTDPQHRSDYLNDLLLSPANREQTYRVVDAFGLLICRDLHSENPGYRDARGRSSKGRLSQGEYYHHDGCSGPTKPRIVEIRFPYQTTERDVATAVAPFPHTVYAMLRHAPSALVIDGKLATWHEELDATGVLDAADLDAVQGLVTRSIRKDLGPEHARAFFREVDALVAAYIGRWHMGESRLISNCHPVTGALGTMQHRRAYLRPHTGGIATGKLVKRWPAEEMI